MHRSGCFFPRALWNRSFSSPGVPHWKSSISEKWSSCNPSLRLPPGSLGNQHAFNLKNRLPSSLAVLGLSDRWSCPLHNSTRVRLLCNAPASKPGLFGVPGLHEPSDFDTLVRKAEEQVTKFCRIAVTGGEGGEPMSGVPLLNVLDDISDALCLVMDAAELCRSVHSISEWATKADDAYNALGSVVQQLNANSALYFALVNAITKSEEAKQRGDTANVFDEDQERMAILLRADFERGGVHLDQSGREAVLELQDRISRLGVQFTQNIHFRQPPVIAVPPELLATLPASVHKYAREVTVRNEQQIHLILARPAVKDILRYALSSDLRRVVYIASQHDEQNLKILEQLIQCRHELATRMGFESYAQYSIANKLAENSGQVLDMLRWIRDGLQPKATEEVASLQRLKEEYEEDILGPETAALQYWDKSLYTSLARTHIGNSSTPSVNDFLPLSAVLEGVCVLVERVFGVCLVSQPIEQDESWAPDVRKMSVSLSEALSPDKTHIGTLYLDLLPRAGKPGGAAHYTVQCPRLLPTGEMRTTCVALVCNFARTDGGGRDGDVLLSHGELEVLLHEFGHVLHSMLGRTRYQHLSGTRTAMDVVEVPSTLMEYFAWEPEFIKMVGRHYKTGERIDGEAVTAPRRGKNMFSALETLQQVAYAAVDLELHSNGADNGSVTGQNGSATDGESHGASQAGWSQPLVEKASHEFGALPVVEGCGWHSSFSHLASYGANYYSYTWCRVLSARLWKVYFEGDPLRPGAGLPFVRQFLMHGASRDPKRMMEDLVGSAEGEAMEVACLALVDELKQT